MPNQPGKLQELWVIRNVVVLQTDKNSYMLVGSYLNMQLSQSKNRTYMDSVQVNFCQKLLFLHQLTHNMTTDCLLNYKFNAWKFKAQPGENMLCTEIVSDIQKIFCTQHVLPMFCKKKSFWQRFTCNDTSFKNCVAHEKKVNH